MSEDKCREAFDGWYDRANGGLKRYGPPYEGIPEYACWITWQAAYKSQQAELTRLREALEVAREALRFYQWQPGERGADSLNRMEVDIGDTTDQALTEINNVLGGDDV